MAKSKQVTSGIPEVSQATMKMAILMAKQLIFELN